MSRTLYFYLPLSVKEAQRILEGHQEDFEVLMGDTFSEAELVQYEKYIDHLASVVVQPILSDLTFDDFYVRADLEARQRFFFEACLSCICIENLPYLDTNPFQVTYLVDLLWCFDDVLIDKGGVEELIFKKEYLDELKKFRPMHVLLKDEPAPVLEVKTSTPVDPIDFLVSDVYKEIERLKYKNQLPGYFEGTEKGEKIFSVMRVEFLDSHALFKKSGLGAKDFDDHLEKLKFWLRKL